jgi:hypothetical protein
MPPAIAGLTVMHHHAQLLVEMGVSLTFCPGFPGTAILLIAAFKVTRIIGMGNWQPPLSEILMSNTLRELGLQHGMLFIIWHLP